MREKSRVQRKCTGGGHVSFVPLAIAICLPREGQAKTYTTLQQPHAVVQAENHHSTHSTCPGSGGSVPVLLMQFHLPAMGCIYNSTNRAHAPKIFNGTSTGDLNCQHWYAVGYIVKPPDLKTISHVGLVNRSNQKVSPLYIPTTQEGTTSIY